MCCTRMKRKIIELLIAFTTFGRVSGILRSLDIRADMCHREALVFFTGAGRTFPEILLTLVQGKFLSAINTHIFSCADFLSCGVCLLFSQLIHQNFHARQRYISVAFVHHKRRKTPKNKKKLPGKSILRIFFKVLVWQERSSGSLAVHLQKEILHCCSRGH